MHTQSKKELVFPLPSISIASKGNLFGATLNRPKFFWQLLMDTVVLNAVILINLNIQTSIELSLSNYCLHLALFSILLFGSKFLFTPNNDPSKDGANPGSYFTNLALFAYVVIVNFGML